MLVHPADISDTEGAEWLLAAHHQSFPLREIRVDEGLETRVRCMDGNEHGDAPECHRKTAWTKGICGHPEAMGGGTRDCVGGTQPFGEERIQPHSRIKRSLSLSWFYRTAPESALSEMLVFDHALSPSAENDLHHIWKSNKTLLFQLFAS